MDMLWVPFSIATILLYGFGQVLAKETRTKGSSANLLVLLSANIFAIWVVYWLVFRSPGSYDASAWLQAIGAAALSGAAYVSYYESIKHGKVSIVGTIAGAYAPLTVVLAIVFLGESMTLGEAIGVVLVVSAMLIFTYSAGDNGNGSKRTEMLGIAFAVMSLFFWGTSAALAKSVIGKMGDTNFIGVYALVCPTIWLMYWLGATGGKFEMPESRGWLLELSLLCFAAGGITLYLAIDFGNVSIVSPVANLYPIVTIAAAKMRLKEKLSIRQMCALAMLMAAVLMLSL